MIFKLKYSVLFLIFLAVCSKAQTYNLSFEQAVIKLKELNLAKSEQWLSLNHYEKSVWGAYKSDITDPSFFVSAEGKDDPEKELESLLKSLWENTTIEKFDEHPICRFPARIKWLKNKLNLYEKDNDIKINEKKCDYYFRFKSVLNTEKVSFVFSSYYANNPGSAFGHTFFRFKRKPTSNGPSNELLDHGIGFAAEMTTDNPVIYAFNGIAGLFKGSYTNLPYYYKVREYNDFEARDLWTYDLDLSPSEIELLEDHLWEVGNSFFSYYFFTKNCAYQMLKVLEVAAPRLKLLDKVPLYVIPSDSIKAIHQISGLVTDSQYRPSIRGVFFKRYDLLSEEGKNIFLNYKKSGNEEILLKAPESEKKKILDAAIDYIDMVDAKTIIDPKSPASKKKHSLLRQRSLIKEFTEEIHVETPENERPELGHGSARFAIGYGSNEDHHSAFLTEFRFALHDLLDPHLGYPLNSQIEFFHFRAESDFESRKTKLLDFDFFQVATINPLSEFSNILSWRGRLGTHYFNSSVCDPDCNAVGFRFGGGYSIYLKSYNLIGYAFIDFWGFYDVHFKDHSYNISTGPTLGFLYRPIDKFKIIGESNYQFQVVRQQKDMQQYSIEGRYHLTNNFQIGARASKELDSDRIFLLTYYNF